MTDASAPRPPDAERVRTADGGEIAWREAGSGTPVVLIHGNFASSRWWAPQLAGPPAGLRLLAPDLPGFGASPPLGGEIAIERYAEALLAFLDALGVERAALAGHSLGGSVAQAAACIAPERVTALLLVDSAAPGGLVTPEEHYPLLEALHGNADAMAAALGPTLVSPDTPAPPPFFGDLVADALAMAPAAFVGNARALAALDLTERVAALERRPPTTVLRGGADPLVDAAAAEATRDAWGARLVTWEGAGHSPHLERPEAFAGLLLELLERAAADPDPQRSGTDP